MLAQLWYIHDLIIQSKVMVGSWEYSVSSFLIGPVAGRYFLYSGIPHLCWMLVEISYPCNRRGARTCYQSPLLGAHTHCQSRLAAWLVSYSHCFLASSLVSCNHCFQSPLASWLESYSHWFGFYLAKSIDLWYYFLLGHWRSLAVHALLISWPWRRWGWWPIQHLVRCIIFNNDIFSLLELWVLVISSQWDS